MYIVSVLLDFFLPSCLYFLLQVSSRGNHPQIRLRSRITIENCLSNKINYFFSFYILSELFTNFILFKKKNKQNCFFNFSASLSVEFDFFFSYSMNSLLIHSIQFCSLFLFEWMEEKKIFVFSLYSSFFVITIYIYGKKTKRKNKFLLFRHKHIDRTAK